MQIIDINIIPKLLKEGKYSKKDIINLLAEFLSSNYSIFGLHKYDEDFRASVYLAFLENADKLIDTYDEQHGCFFTFYFCFIKTLITTENRKKARKSIECEFIAEECQNQFYEFNQNYSTLTGSINYPSKIPFNYNKPQREDLAQIFLNENVSKRDKTILILALKSSFYITDEQIKKVSDLLKIDSNLLQDTIQDFKNDLLKKQDRRNIYE